MAGGGDMLTDGKGTGLGACSRIVVAALQVGEVRISKPTLHQTVLDSTSQWPNIPRYPQQGT